jgi:hypothetical protein
VHGALDRQRGGLDELRPVVDLVELVEPPHASGVGDRDERVELPEVLDGERDSLLVGEAPEDVGGDRASEVGVELGEAPVDHRGSGVYAGRERGEPELAGLAIGQTTRARALEQRIEIRCGSRGGSVQAAGTSNRAQAEA